MTRMNKEDKEEIKGMLNDTINLWIVKEQGSHKIIEMKLDTIHEQTLKTNGRVNKNEDNIRVLEDENLRTSTVKKWMYKSISAVSIIIGIVWVGMKMIETLS